MKKTSPTHPYPWCLGARCQLSHTVNWWSKLPGWCESPEDGKGKLEEIWIPVRLMHDSAVVAQILKVAVVQIAIFPPVICWCFPLSKWIHSSSPHTAPARCCHQPDERQNGLQSTLSFGPCPLNQRNCDAVQLFTYRQKHHIIHSYTSSWSVEKLLFQCQTSCNQHMGGHTLYMYAMSQFTDSSNLALIGSM